VTLELRRIWELYRTGGGDRMVAWDQFRERSQDEVFECLAWLYDGFPFARAERSGCSPQRGSPGRGRLSIPYMQ